MKKDIWMIIHGVIGPELGRKKESSWYLSSASDSAEDNYKVDQPLRKNSSHHRSKGNEHSKLTKVARVTPLTKAVVRMQRRVYSSIRYDTLKQKSEVVGDDSEVGSNLRKLHITKTSMEETRYKGEPLNLFDELDEGSDTDFDILEPEG